MIKIVDTFWRKKLFIFHEISLFLQAFFYFTRNVFILPTNTLIFFNQQQTWTDSNFWSIISMFQYHVSAGHRNWWFLEISLSISSAHRNANKHHRFRKKITHSFLWHGHEAKIDYSFRQIGIEMFALKRSMELLKRLVLSICQESCTLSVIDGRSKCRYWF